MVEYSDFLCGREWEFTDLGSRYFGAGQSFNGAEFSVMSYNILAQNLLEDNKHLYQSVHPRSLEWNNRRYRLLLELRFYNPHVVCMQEVHEAHLAEDLWEVFDSMGYHVVYQARTGDKQDGCLIMFKANYFKLISEKKVRFFRKGVPSLDRDNVAVIVLLSPVSHPDLKVCIATTHLLFNPRRGDVKLSQLCLLLAEMNSLISSQSAARSNNSNYSIPCILCGDFNSKPFSPLYNFITRGSIDYTKCTGSLVSGQENRTYGNLLSAPLLPTSIGVQKDCTFAPPNIQLSQIAPIGPVLSHSLDLGSVHNHEPLRYPEAHEVTSYHDHSEETLDYIFYSRKTTGKPGSSFLAPLCRLGLLTTDELKSRGGLPNRVQPSDHLPLIASFLLSSRAFPANAK